MTGRSIPTVTSQLELQLIIPGESTVPLTVDLRYSIADPYAVHAEFRTGGDESVEWVFARELLSTGISESCGEGDVRVWPSPGGHDVVFVALASPDGQALLQASGPALAAFLDRTFALVPLGLETVDIDATLDALLSR